ICMKTHAKWFSTAKAAGSRPDFRPDGPDRRRTHAGGLVDARRAPGKGRGRRLSWRSVDTLARVLAHARGDTSMALDDKSRTELEAAVFRRLVEHLRTRTDVQNIDLMNLAGFCRNCLSNWMKEEADKTGVALDRNASREAVYGMPYDEWKAKYQREASGDQKAAFDKSHKH